MNPGPLRRLVGLLGLLAVAPIAVLLFTGAIDPVAAAQRAVVVLIVVVVLGRITSSYLHTVARRFDVADGERSVITPGIVQDGEHGTA